MAFKPTSGRSVFTQPTGTPDLSGFKNAAAQYQSLSKMAFNIGTDIRTSQYNDAIRQAEIDGKTSGVKYEKDENGQWKLQPLINFDYAKATSMYSKGEQEGVLRAYREAAIGSYVSAAVNDISNAANQALEANKSNPDGVRGAFDGYLKGMSNLDPEIFAHLAPKAEAAFMEAENRALAQQQKDVEAQSRVDLGTHFKTNIKELGNLYAVGPVEDDDTAVEGFEMRVQELLDENEKLLENLEVMNETPEAIQAYRDMQTNHIAQRIGSAHIERVWTSSGGNMEQTLIAIEGIVEQAEDNPDSQIDAESLRTVLTSKANNLNDIEKAQKAEASENRENIYQDYMFRVYVKGEDISKQLQDPNSPIYQLEGGQIGSLLSVSKAERESYINEQYADNFGILKSWQSVINTPFEQGLGEKFDNIYQMYKHGALDLERFIAARDSYSQYLDEKFVAPNARAAGVSLIRELGNDSSYAFSPDHFRAIMPDLIKRGVIGSGRGASYKDVQAYEKSISDYAKRYKKFITELAEGKNALALARAGVEISSTELESMHKVTSNYRAILPNGQAVATNFVTEDEVLFQASVDAADRYANETNGYLLPEAKRIFEGARTNENLADRSVRIMGQIVDGMARQSGLPIDTELNHFFDVNGFSEDDRAFFQLANKIGIENAQAAYEGFRDIDINKGIQRLVGNRVDGKMLDKAVDDEFDKAFAGAVTGHDWWSLFNPKISPERQAMLREFADSAGLSMGDLSTAIIRDSVVREGLKGIWLQRWEASKGQGNPVEIMRSAMQSIGKRFGYEEDTATGQIYLVERPILHFAQATVPGRTLNDGTVIPSVQLSQSMIVEDVVKKYLQSGPEGALRNEVVDEAVRMALDPNNLNASDVTFHPNSNFGGVQTYTVIVTDHNGIPYTIANNYSYDFNTSIQNPYFQKVMDTMKSSKVKEFYSVFGLMDTHRIQAAFENYHQTGSDMSLFPLIQSLNEVRLLTSPGASPEYIKSLGEPWKYEEVQELMRVWNNLIAWGKL